MQKKEKKEKPVPIRCVCGRKGVPVKYKSKKKNGQLRRSYELRG